MNLFRSSPALETKSETKLETSYTVGSIYNLDDEFAAEILEVKQGWVAYRIIDRNPFDPCTILETRYLPLKKFKVIYKEKV